MPVALLIYFCLYFFLLLFFFFFSVLFVCVFAFCLSVFSFVSCVVFCNTMHSLHILTLHLCVCLVHVYMSTCLKTEFKKWQWLEERCRKPVLEVWPRTSHCPLCVSSSAWSCTVSDKWRTTNNLKQLNPATAGLVGYNYQRMRVDLPCR